MGLLRREFADQFEHLSQEVRSLLTLKEPQGSSTPKQNPPNDQIGKSKKLKYYDCDNFVAKRKQEWTI